MTAIRIQKKGIKAGNLQIGIIKRRGFCKSARFRGAKLSYKIILTFRGVPKDTTYDSINS